MCSCSDVQKDQTITFSENKREAACRRWLRLSFPHSRSIFCRCECRFLQGRDGRRQDTVLITRPQDHGHLGPTQIRPGAPRGEHGCWHNFKHKHNIVSDMKRSDYRKFTLVDRLLSTEVRGREGSLSRQDVPWSDCVPLFRCMLNASVSGMG